MKHVVTVPALAALLAFAGGGCSDSTGLDKSARLMGVLQFESSAPVAASADPDQAIRWSITPGVGITYPPTVLEAPDTVNLDQTFEARVYTVGMNGCWRADGVVQAKTGRTVEFTPYDIHSGAEVCTQAIAFLPHTSSVRLDQRGEWTLRAKGRRVRGGLLPDEPVSAERTIFVR